MITDLRWLDPARDIYQDSAQTTNAADGDPVGGWADQGINNDDASSTTTARPAYDADAFGAGKPGLVFNGSSHLLNWNSIAAMLSGSDLPWSICMAVKLARINVLQSLFGASSTTATQPIHFVYNDNANSDWRSNRRPDGSLADSVRSGGATDTEPHVLTFVFYGKTAVLRLDGTELFRRNQDVNTMTVNRVTLGALVRSTTSFYAQMTLGDVMFVPRAWTAAEVPNIEQFIASRCGLSFTSNALDLEDVGAWTFYNNPRGVRAGDYSVYGAINEFGDVIARTYNHTTQAESEIMFHEAFQLDDHANPAFLTRASDSKIMAFYTRHNDYENYYQRVLTNANDPTAWDNAIDIRSQIDNGDGGGYSYAVPIQLSGEMSEPIYLFHRRGSSWYRGKSSDGGATWTTIKLLTNGAERPYFHAVANGDSRIDFVCTTGHPAEVICSIYHGYYEAGNWYASDGTLVGADADMPFAPSDFTLVYDGTTTNSWNYDIAIDGSGNPVILFGTFPDLDTDHRYYYGHWTGAAWDVNQICEAGGPMVATGDSRYYSGGCGLDHSNPNIVYVSREVAGVFRIYKETTADGGASWTETAITDGTEHCYRPWVIEGHNGTMQLAYMRGQYIGYTDYTTRTVLQSA
jgi:hypothetical protein